MSMGWVSRFRALPGKTIESTGVTSQYYIASQRSPASAGRDAPEGEALTAPAAHLKLRGHSNRGFRFLDNGARGMT
jgi:hypothetical protein